MSRKADGPLRFVEDMPRLSATMLHRAGLLSDGMSGRLTVGQESLPVTVTGDALVLEFGWGKQTIRFLLRSLEYINPKARNPFFACPRCGSTRRHLYLDREFLCRECLNLAHAKQYEPPYKRLVRRLNACGGGLFDGNLPARPKGMRQEVYARLVEVALENRREWGETMGGLLCKMADLDREAGGTPKVRGHLKGA